MSKISMQRSSLLGAIRNPKGFISNNLPFRQAQGLAPFGGLEFLYANGAVPGAWFNFVDTSTMYQDTEGKNPVTAFGQSVGLVLDKQAGAARGIDLVTNGICAGTAGWRGAGGTLTSPNENTVRVETGIGAEAFAFNDFLVTAGRTYEIIFYLVGANNSGAVTLGSVRRTIPGGSNNSGQKRIILTAAASNTNGVAFSTNTPTNGFFIEVDNVSVREIPGNHATFTNCTVEQDEAGYPYLNFNGVDSGGQTASINFTGTDKMTVFAGVRKNSDAARGAVVDLSTSPTVTPGTFSVEAPGNALNNYAGSGGGSTLRTVWTGAAVVAPNSSVLTLQDDIDGDSLSIRLNGVLYTSDTGDQGIGNFTANPLYIGRRGGAGVPFNGRLYNLAVAGTNYSELDILRAENIIANQMSFT